MRLGLVSSYFFGLAWSLFMFDVQAQTFFSIDETISIAKSNSGLLKREKEKLNLYEADIITAGLRPNPLLNQQTLQLANLDYSPNHSNNYLNNHNRQVWYQLTKSFQLGHLRENKINFSKKALELQQKKYYDIERTLCFQVADEWITLWYLKEQISILKDLKDNTDTLVLIGENQLKNGVISTSDLLRIQMLSEKYDIDVKILQMEYANNLRILKRKIGQTDSIEIKETTFFENDYFAYSIDTLIQITMERRTDLKVEQSRLDFYNSNISLQRALAYPKFEAGIIYNPQNAIVYAGTYSTLVLPFFDRNQGERHKAQYLVSQSKMTISYKELQIRNELQTDYSSYLSLAKSVQLCQSMQQKSRSILKSVLYTYLKRYTSIIDFMESQRSYLETKKMCLDNSYSYRKNYIKLLYDTGIITDLN